MAADKSRKVRASTANAGNRGKGRKKGVPNKLTGDVKAMILGALEAKGGVKYLAAKADSHPQAFMALLGRVLPLQVQGDPANPVRFIVMTGVEGGLSGGADD